jgi:hypothetical protein
MHTSSEWDKDTFIHFLMFSKFALVFPHIPSFGKPNNFDTHGAHATRQHVFFYGARSVVLHFGWFLIEH